MGIGGPAGGGVARRGAAAHREGGSHRAENARAITAPARRGLTGGGRGAALLLLLLLPPGSPGEGPEACRQGAADGRWAPGGKRRKKDARNEPKEPPDVKHTRDGGSARAAEGAKRGIWVYPN